MPFDLQKFEDTFGFSMDKFSLDNMMTEFQIEQSESTDKFSVYRAIIATQEFNSNYLFLDDDTLSNIAKESNRDTAGKDIPIFPNHNRYDFQIGTMLSGKYVKSRKRVEGTFNIIKDAETEVLINRINNKVVRGVSPTIKGDVYCDIDGEKMYRYGASKSGYYLGETVKIDGKDRLVTGTFKNAHLVEVSVVSMQAFPGATIFSENKDLLEQALAEGIIDEKALDMIEYSFSVDLGIKPSKPESLPPEPAEPTNPQPEGEPAVATPTDADTKLLQDQITDLNQQVTDKNTQIQQFNTQVAELQKRPTVEEFEQKENALSEANKKLIEKESELGTAQGVVSEYDASVEHVREKAIEFYAKVRGVEVDNTTDPLFVNRKKALQDSKSLTYLLSSYEQYQASYYASTTEFGGQTEKELTRPVDSLPYVNPNHY